MASWAVHFRISDCIIGKLNNIDENYFIIGNIAPDCGVPTKNGYYPPSEITHRTHNGNYKGNCDYNSVYEEFLKNNDDIKSFSFWLGYYVHLMTDCLWVNDLCQLICDDFNSLSHGSSKAKKIRKEWYNLDFLYFNENTSCSFEKFKQIESFNETYPSFYCNNEISKQIKNITQFYTVNKPLEINYEFTTPDMVEKFISDSATKIYNDLIGKGVLK